ncbi:MAG: ACP S-malonyltransferase [Rhodospirillaceae bacterium]|jgi:[acyl-carrier-protein] S-malonyltransferase|nr:ACP S-malonyltransferase [Rhodospirillaceae bacterium]MBT3491190.1 ACP S-malonyltransferase [Rhodospirillaceae bacterium]MBT3781187.1 ACP S-malonyltransferase [Rhodospirillaceae bacterium]MBT3979493.1 ACP S-malonyltransferase [Rhodospirillaceae bacterium]MBT4168036.1 ACP S-malonyltransferase [Rhodospirillaceae bacterium]
MARAFVFPGQGSQAVGMGKALADALPTARQVFEEVDEALSQNLSRLMFEGPIEELTLTENAQPALMAMSLAVVRVLRNDGGLEFGKHCQFVAGHSLGEYSALCAADAIPLDVTARLLKKRGQAMQQAVPVGVGAMAALLGLDFEAAQGVANDAAQDQVCDTANDNAPGQVVVSGNVEAVERAIELAKERGARRPMLLPVSAPFHCALMQPAADVMAEALQASPPVAPAVPLIANVSAEAVSDPDEIRDLLVRQVTAMVRWRESVLYLRGRDVDHLVEVGAGKVLTTMLKRIDKEISGQAISEPDDIEAFLKSI